MPVDHRAPRGARRGHLPFIRPLGRIECGRLAGREFCSSTSSEEECENLANGVAESASALTLEEPDVSSSEVYFIRVDYIGYFCMYQNLSGPFQSICQAEYAIDHHLSKLQHASLSEKIVAGVAECASALTLLEPDASPLELLLDYASSEESTADNSPPLACIRSKVFEWICEKIRLCYYFNITGKTKMDDIYATFGKLLLSGLSHMQRENALDINCCYMIDYIDNGLQILFPNPVQSGPFQFDAVYATSFHLHRPLGPSLTDHWESLYMHPCLAGLFQSLAQAESAIGHHPLNLWLPLVEPDNLSREDKLILQHIHHLDGTPKRSSQSVDAYDRHCLIQNDHSHCNVFFSEESSGFDASSSSQGPPPTSSQGLPPTSSQGPQGVMGSSPDDWEVSWKDTLFRGQNLMPKVRHQRLRPTCVFQALSAQAEMEWKRLAAKREPPEACDIRFNVNSFIRAYQNIAGPLGTDQELFRATRRAKALEILHQNGVLASEGGDDALFTNKKISGYQWTGDLDFSQIGEIIDDGKPIVGAIPMDSYFHLLKADEIYDFDEEIAKKTATGGNVMHAVLFVGYGMRGGRTYLVFLNSFGKRFGDDGYGRVYLDHVSSLNTIEF